MKTLGIFLIILLVSGCVNQTDNTAKVFTNAQIQYQSQEPHSIIRKRDMAMPSYFFVIDYEPSQITLNKMQEKRMEAVFKKLIYPEEYKLYVSFGADKNDKLANLGPVLKRAQDIRRKYTGKLKSIQIAYIKNQKPDSAYFRLIT